MKPTMERITNQSSESKSLDITDANIEQLKQIFPEVFSEGKVDFEALKDALGELVDNSEESYQFTWNGKSKARQIARTPSTGTLRPCKEESVNWESTENLFIEGDNLEVLKLLQKSYFQKVKAIFIDPPYNTGKDFVYKDSFQDNIKNYLKQTGQVDIEGKPLSSNTEASGRYHTDWLNMIYPRLKLARNLLKNDGVIFIAIDDSELTNLRKVCDEIYGEDNFLANIAWKHTQQSKNDEPYFSRQYNSIVVYRKSSDLNKLRFPRSEEDNKNYSNPDNDPKGKWRSGDFRSPNYRSTLCYDIKTPNGNVISPPANGWRWTKEEVDKKIKEGEIVFNEEQTRLTRKIYLYKQDGRTPENLWSGEQYGTTRHANADLKELFDGKAVFDTPKPAQLINRILQMFKDESSIILDFFAGSCPTGQAVYDYNLQNNKKWKYILVQLPEKCNEKSEAYRLGYRVISEIGKDRLKKSISRIESNNTEIKNSLGVRVFKLDETNIKPWDADFDDPKAVFLNSIESIKDGRKDDDVLYEVLLKYGIELTTYIEEELIDGKKVYVIGAGALVVCLDNEITTSLVESICKLEQVEDSETTQVVFKDAGFADSTIKTNAVQILKQAGIEDVKSL